MEDKRIHDDQITSSSHWNHPTLSHGADNARLNREHDSQSTSAWSTATNNLNQWIQVDLLERKQITGVITQGRSKSEKQLQWVTKYKIQYSDDGTSWNYVDEPNVRFLKQIHVSTMFISLKL